MKKRIQNLFLKATAVVLLFASCCNSADNTAVEIKGHTDKEAISNILERKSVRSFTDQPVEQEKIDLILRAGMAAPSGMDRRPWEIVIVHDRTAMDSLSQKLPYAQMLKQAPMAIVVCGNSDLSSMWYLDCSAVTQNILLAVEALDLGAVWTGVYPNEDRMDMVREALDIPANIHPLAMIPVGYPAGENVPKDKYDESKVHYNKW